MCSLSRDGEGGLAAFAVLLRDAEDTSFNMQPYFKVRRCQAATLPDALAAALCICRRVMVVPSGP